MIFDELPVAWRLSSKDVQEGWRALWWTVGRDGELAVMLVQRRYLSRDKYPRGWIGWRTETPFDGKLVIASGQEERRIPVEGIDMRPRHLALLPGSRFLLAAGRTHQDAEGAWWKNAVVYSPEGRPEGAFCLGDDIPALVTDRSGGIWTAYGDEGIYGNHPESAAGLAGWNTRGIATWAPEGRLPDWPLQGCTAATEGEAVWLVWYSPKGTFLTRITPSTGEVASYRSPVKNPDGFAVLGTRVVLTSRDHYKRRTTVTRAELVGDVCVAISQERVRVPGRVVMHCGQGRDGTLFLRAGRTWVRVDA
ncbi:hypothetical protein OIE43_42855 [Streptomyces pseudovenezuelae]|uniref:hypothetical protein n=1 Tax=Streptomyces pseudovenezuelae TaxID=67350 RepID=UPI002E37796A|nr:hypothetical protein [Streptomyces pseudovenezuelae]